MIWASGPPREVCFRVPPSENVNPKALVLYGGDSSSKSFYATGLGGAGPDRPLRSDYQGCSMITFSEGLPSGPFTIKLEDGTSKGMLAYTSFRLARARVDFKSYKTSASSLTLKVKWSIDASDASTTDIVKIYNSQGTVVKWFYTACGCATAPAAGAKASEAGTADVTLTRTGAVPGGYTARLFPAGADAVAAVGPPWINWQSIGW